MVDLLNATSSESSVDGVPHVVGLCSGTQVVGVYTRLHVAGVHDHKAVGDGAVVQLMADPVSETPLAEPAIPVPVQPALPDPALILGREGIGQEVSESLPVGGSLAEDGGEWVALALLLVMSLAESVTGASGSTAPLKGADSVGWDERPADGVGVRVPCVQEDVVVAATEAAPVPLASTPLNETLTVCADPHGEHFTTGGKFW